MKTYMPKEGEVKRDWHVIDLEGKVLGRAATKIASVLRGKHKPQFTPHADVGDFVVVLNADKVALTGRKESDKIYYRTGIKIGHLKERTAAEMREKDPEAMVYSAVKRMLPRNSLGRAQLTKLKIYAGTDHPHAAQKPTVMEA